ncbi:hypothetical protein [Helicobacter turcicus]|uniref:Uncharacterized protein n=1 Tax=Helicobacter turcicus TaxID=2867412 RepID=A0ABS7JKV4_9HELI|nr:hypothetical protein [Helicobacter turcicus]MBX7490024.1 hypothetical protein [Helicobacter turcicus]MBX7544883.1 hypothetical protein [Helicobacter turcicus]
MEVLLKDKKFQAMQGRHCYEILEHLIRRKINFSILCNVECVKFEPSLPQEIRSAFSELTLFILAGYTFESLELDEQNLYFEAGFGEENLGSFVTAPLDSIVQILLPNHDGLQSDFCIYVNLFATFAKIKSSQTEEEEGINSSMQALLANPKNKRFKK